MLLRLEERHKRSENSATVSNPIAGKMVRSWRLKIAFRANADGIPNFLHLLACLYLSSGRCRAATRRKAN